MTPKARITPTQQQVLDLLQANPNYVVRVWFARNTNNLRSVVVYDLKTDRAVLQVRDQTFYRLRDMECIVKMQNVIVDAPSYSYLNNENWRLKTT